METMINFLTTVLLVFGILQIILFFKIWGMTNNVKSIKQIMENIVNEQQKKYKNELANTLNVGDCVVTKYGKQMRIKEIKEGKYACYTNNYSTFEGLFDRSEIKKYEGVDQVI